MTQEEMQAIVDGIEASEDAEFESDVESFYASQEFADLVGE